MKEEFKECESCAAKPGSPTLCESCLHNRTLVNQLRDSKENAYYERNQLVAALSKLYPAWLGWHKEKDWEDEWRNIVYVRIPTRELHCRQFQGGHILKFKRQLSWHIHEKDLKYFDHLKPGLETWDGHSTEEKYSRLADIKY